MKQKEWCEYPQVGDWVKYKRVIRCPVCRKRLRPRKQFCTGGEFVGWKLPKHKKK